MDQRTSNTKAAAVHERGWQERDEDTPKQWYRDIDLTTKKAKSIQAPLVGNAYYFDRKKPYLGLRVLPLPSDAPDRRAGRKSWIYSFGFNGKFYRRVIESLERCTAEEALHKADVAIGKIKQGIDPREEKRDQRRAREEQERARSEADQAAKDAQQHTLKRLCELYVDDLKGRGRSAWRDARSIFDVYVYREPEAARPARELTPEDIADITHRVVKAGHGRTAAKLRSYLRAAYQRAAVARTNAAVSREFKDLGIVSNPVAATAPLSEFNNRPRERKALSPEELTRVVCSLSKDAKDKENLPARAAWACVLLAGQRPAQLMRAKAADFEDGKALTIYDPKGGRKRQEQPREHLVPVIGKAAAILKDFAKTARERGSVWLFSTHGKVPLRPETINDEVIAISEALAGEAKKAKQPFEPFSLRDLRATVETYLASKQVSAEIRAHLLSHGLSGVQARHYDKHDYVAEKTKAIALWHKYIAKLMESAARKGAA